jgi:hypothetical protein
MLGSSDARIAKVPSINALFEIENQGSGGYLNLRLRPYLSSDFLIPHGLRRLQNVVDRSLSKHLGHRAS